MLQKICNFFIGIMILILAVLAGILIVPRVLGYTSFAVLSGSMTPEISVGSIVFAKETPFEDFEIGDIVTYKLSDEMMVTHRITEIDNDKQEFGTKGDANDAVDAEPIVFSRVVGKVAFHVPYLGYMTIYIKTPIGIAAICGVLFILILLFFLPEIFKKEEKTKKIENK